MNIKRINYFAFSIIIIGSVIRLYELNLQSLWLDESTSLQFAKHDLIGCIFSEVNNPPLYSLLLKFWIYLFGYDSDAIIRYLSAIFGVLTLIPFWNFAKKILPSTYALLALIFFSFNPYHLYFSQEARAYSLLIFLTVVSIDLFYENLSNQLNCFIMYCKYSRALYTLSILLGPVA